MALIWGLVSTTSPFLKRLRGGKPAEAIGEANQLDKVD